MIDGAGSTAGRAGRVLLVGVGDGGCAALGYILAQGLHGFDSLAANTCQKAVAQSGANWRLLLGRAVAQGQSTGGNPRLGRHAAEESANDLKRALTGAQRVVVLAALGGGTGSGAAPVVAYLARELGADVLPIVSRPYAFEGPARAQIASGAILSLKRRAGQVTVIDAAQLQGWLPNSPAVDKAYDLLIRAMAWQVLALFTGMPLA